MLEIIRRKVGIKIKEIYFFQESGIEIDRNDADILFFIQRNNQCEKSSQFITSIIDLNEDEAVLFSRIKKNTKYEINRAKNKDDWKAEIVSDPTSDQLLELKVKFDTFAKEKKIRSFNIDKLIQLNQKKGLIISLGSLESEILIMHVYIIDGQRARLLYSCNFNDDNEVDLSIIGRGNRMLHWEDILWFKKSGLQYYDFGGLGTQTEKERNIAQFKRDFGGQDITEWNLMKGVSFKGKTILKLFNIVQIVKKK